MSDRRPNPYPQSPQSQPEYGSPGPHRQLPPYEFDPKEEDDPCCNCCLAPCKFIGLLLFLPCCIYSCCQARSQFSKGAKEFKKQSTEGIISRPPITWQSSVASEVKSKIQSSIPATSKYKVEPAPDKVQVLDQSGSSEQSGVDNKDFIEMESLPKPEKSS